MLNKKIIITFIAISVLLTTLTSCKSSDKNISTSTPTDENSIQSTVKPSESPQSDEFSYFANICENGINWDKGFTDSKDLTVDDLINFYLYSGENDVKTFLDETLNKYYIPVQDVETFGKKYFENFKFDPQSATILVYDSENEYFIGDVEEKTTSSNANILEINKSDFCTEFVVEYKDFQGIIQINDDKKIISAVKKI